MHRTQIYLQEALYEQLKARSRHLGLSLSELIRRSLEKDLEQHSAADARAFFERLPPLASFADTEPETYVREQRSASRLLRDASDDA